MRLNQQDSQGYYWPVRRAGVAGEMWFGIIHTQEWLRNVENRIIGVVFYKELLYILTLKLHNIKIKGKS